MRIRHLSLPLLATTLLLGAAFTATAQSAQPLSILAAGFAGRSGQSSDQLANGYGFEAQARLTFGRFSFGGGYVRTSVDDRASQGFLVEPRMAFDVGSDYAAPYLALRGAMTTMESIGPVAVTGLDVGGGAGVLLRLNRVMNFDIGFAAVSSTRTAKLGGQSTSFSFGNYAAKLGLSVGLGG